MGTDTLGPLPSLQFPQGQQVPGGSFPLLALRLGGEGWSFCFPPFEVPEGRNVAAEGAAGPLVIEPLTFYIQRKL